MVRNTTIAWGWPAKLFHWLGALAILLLIGHGWWMVHMAPRADRFAHYAGHAALGYDVLALLMLRLLWRWTHPVPALPGDLRRWERIAARAGHIGLYVLMLAASFSGWALAGTFRTPISADLFNLNIPQIVASQDRAIHGFFEETHMILCICLLCLFACISRARCGIIS
jgi:cytochrome b561